MRSALHLQSGRKSDRVLRDQQDDIARAMGFEDEPRLLAADGLMRAIFEHARAVDALTDDVIIRRSRTDGGAPVPVELADAAEAFALVASWVEEGRQPSAAELDALEAIAAEPFVWSDTVRDAFLRLLRAGPAAVDGLRALDRTGLLVRAIPEWADVRCRPQRDPYHRYTVDMHLLRAFERTSRALAAPDAEDPVEVVAVDLIRERDGVLLGALLHDVGKNGEGSHVAVGDRLASGILERMGVEGSTRALATFMVAQHLLLPDTATRRDLGDDDLILDVAARIETPERLAALFLLAKADALATGPAAWTPWRQTLIRELVAKVRRVLERGEMGVEVAERLTDAIGRVRDLLHDEDAAAVERFIMRMPRSYFLSIPPAQIAQHYATIAPDLGRHDVRTSTWPGARAGAYELLVVAADRPGLLSWIAGALSLAGLSILTAQVFTTEDGAAADLFEVQGAFEPVVGEERWREFRHVLRKAIDGRVSLEHRMTEKRRHYPERSDTPVTVTVDNGASDFFTVIEVGAPDRIGLLYDITRTLAELELDVHLAKVATYTDRVIDAFYVRDALGRKLDDAEQTSAVGAALRARIVRSEPIERLTEQRSVRRHDRRDRVAHRRIRLRRDPDRAAIRHALGRGRRDERQGQMDALPPRRGRERERRRPVLEPLRDVLRSPVRPLQQTHLHRDDDEPRVAAASVNDERVLDVGVVLERDPEAHVLAVLHAHRDLLPGAGRVVDAVAQPRVGQRIDRASGAEAAELDPGVRSRCDLDRRCRRGAGSVPRDDGREQRRGHGDGRQATPSSTWFGVTISAHERPPSGSSRGIDGDPARRWTQWYGPV